MRLSQRSVRPVVSLMWTTCLLWLLVWGLSPQTALVPLTAADPKAEFPRELTEWIPAPENPLFTGAGEKDWDAKIRERGWILREGNTYHMWYTGYDGTKEGIRRLGYATSPDGRKWTRHPGNPLIKDLWIEDVHVVKRGDTYYMFAEGVRDRAHLLSSKDKITWTPLWILDIRLKNGQPIPEGPYGTPVGWYDEPASTWYLFYERSDLGIWLATSRDLKVWTNVQDDPVIPLGPGQYDSTMIAINQIVKYQGKYYTIYHASGDKVAPRQWTTCIAMSTDLVHWKKFPGNPILGNNKSSGILVPDGDAFRLYTMHDQVHLHHPRK